ncbi:hypothetical protein [Stenotrophomonas phage RAS14]
MNVMHNIERINGRWVGYDSKGQAHRISGNTHSGYIVKGKSFKYLRSVSEYLYTVA